MTACLSSVASWESANDCVNSDLVSLLVSQQLSGLVREVLSKLPVNYGVCVGSFLNELIELTSSFTWPQKVVLGLV